VTPTRASIIEILKEGPMTEREISARIIQDARERWAEAKGYEIDWNDPPVGASLLALGQARDQGLKLHAHEIHNDLRWLERNHLISRIQIPGRRPMLWTLA
jgi:hypothetical protein